MTDGDGGAQPEGAAAEDYYNPIFEVLSGKNDPLVAAVAYSLYKQAKREWVLNFRATHGRRPSLSEHRVHAQTQTEQILSAYTAMASQVLAAYADAAIMGAAPRI